MILATHIIIAAAVTKPIAHMHPALIFGVAVASHYLSDALPHWDYELTAIADKENTATRHWNLQSASLAHDIVRFSLDAIVGAAFVIMLLSPLSFSDWIAATLAIIGGALPDFLGGLYMLGLKFLLPHQRFHDWIHTKIRLGPYPLIGIPFQILIAAIAVWFLS